MNTSNGPSATTWRSPAWLIVFAIPALFTIVPAARAADDGQAGGVERPTAATFR